MKIEIFDEIYGCYFTAVFHILKEAGKRRLTKKQFEEIVNRNADIYGFRFLGTTRIVLEKALYVEKEYTWPFFKEVNGGASYRSELDRMKGLPLSDLEKMWLKSIYSDPRIKLFLPQGCEPDELKNVEPLFNWDDYVLFDQYNNGDPFQEDHYIEIFRTVLNAVQKKKRLEIKFRKPNNNIRFYEDGSYERAASPGIGTHYIDPDYLEYSERDNRFRLIGNNPRFGRNSVNIEAIESCREVEKQSPQKERYEEPRPKESYMREVVCELTNDKNALERFLLNFSHYEKRADYLEKKKKYLVTITYDEADAIDLLIRVLSFGPYVRVVEPGCFVDLVRNRLKMQLSVRDGPK